MADFLTIRFESIHITNRIKSIRIANWNALVMAVLGLNLKESLKTIFKSSA